MSKASTQRGTSASAKKAFEHRDGTGSLFYDAPGVPTLSGSFKFGRSFDVTGEPQVDKNSRDYVRITGEGVSGGLFVNDRKENERHPDYSGPIEVDGQKLRLAAWKKAIKTGQNAGQEYLSIAISEPQQRDQG